jgi:hypothetical protein
LICKPNVPLQSRCDVRILRARSGTRKLHSEQTTNPTAAAVLRTATLSPLPQP